MSDHTGRRHASRGGGCSKTSAHTGRSGGGGGMLAPTVRVPCVTCRQTHRSANIASRRTPSTTTYARRQSKANSHGLVSVCLSVRPITSAGLRPAPRRGQRTFRPFRRPIMNTFLPIPSRTHYPSHHFLWTAVVISAQSISTRRHCPQSGGGGGGG